MRAEVAIGYGPPAHLQEKLAEAGYEPAVAAAAAHLVSDLGSYPLLQPTPACHHCTELL